MLSASDAGHAAPGTGVGAAEEAGGVDAARDDGGAPDVTGDDEGGGDGDGGGDRSEVSCAGDGRDPLGEPVAPAT